MGYKPDMDPIWKIRLAKALDEKGINMLQASRLAGKSDTYVRDMLKRDKEPTIENFVALARVVAKPVSYLLGETAEPIAAGLRAVTVAAHIQAGVWTETWEWDGDDQYQIYIPDLPEFRGFRLYAAETRGPSMNRRYPERTVLVFTDVRETLEQPEPGKRYIVERRRAGGETEHTVKLLHRDVDGKHWLLPESDDPRFQTPISIEDGTGDEDSVALIGRVHFSVARE